MPKVLCQKSYPQTQIFGKPTANSIPAFTFFLLLARFASILSSPCSGVQEQSETRAE